MNMTSAQKWFIPALCLLSAVEAWATPGLTIYNQNFAVVRDQVTLDLDKGINQVSVNEITAHLEPSSVIIRDPSGKQNIKVLEQNYRSDPVSQELLMSIYEGKEISFIAGSNTVKGRIIRSGYVPHQGTMQQYGSQYATRQMAYVQGSAGQSIIEVEGQIRFSLPGIPIFPSLGDEAILKPTLSWSIDSDRKNKLAAELCYITGGMRWQADYNVVAPDEGNSVDVVGWVTMDNQSGRTFSDARIKLMAGDVNKVRGDSDQSSVVGGMARTSGFYDAGSPNLVKEKAFDEYHMYSLERPTTLRDRETKQVEFIRVNGAMASTVYVYQGVLLDSQRYRGYSTESIRQERDFGTRCNRSVWIMKEFQNTKENQLGIPLPQGKVRFYRRDTDGQVEFTGENNITHTPSGETVRVFTGNAFDIVGERRRIDYKIDDNRRWVDETFEITLRNRKEKESVEVRVVEDLYRWTNWEILEKSSTYLKTDSQTIEFRIQLAPGAEGKTTYKVHYSW